MGKNRDEKYWAEFYRSGVAPEAPSMFADYVLQKYAKLGRSILELGCGNGRDAHHFAANGLDVYAVDQCAYEIDELVRSNGTHDNLRFAVADFTDMPNSENGGYDMVYSRFTLHSVTAEGQQKTLDWCYRNLVGRGLLFIETRGQKNELYELGAPVENEPNAFIYNDHFRRFVDFEEFTGAVTDTGFEVLEAAEETGFAPFNDTDHHFIRVIAQK